MLRVHVEGANFDGTNRGQRRPGVAVVEFAFVLPILLVLLLGIWEVGRMLEAHQIISNAAREGGRTASTALKSNAEVVEVVHRYLESAGVPLKNVKVVTKVGGDAVKEANSALQLEQISVTVSVPVRDVVWHTLEVFTPMSSNIEFTSVWYSMRNKDYPSPADPEIDY